MTINYNGMNFEVTIGEKVKTPTNCYIVECKAMYGDADGYGQLDYGEFKFGRDEDILVEFIEFCERMKNAYPHGRGGYDDYDHIEGFYKWFNQDDMDNDEWETMDERIKKFCNFYWLRDPQGDGMQASFKGYKVFHYDVTGAKFNVTVK